MIFGDIRAVINITKLMAEPKSMKVKNRGRYDRASGISVDEGMIQCKIRALLELCAKKKCLLETVY